MKGFDESWTRAEAVHALCFWDPDTDLSGVGERRMHQLISAAFENMPLRSTTLPLRQQQALLQAVQAVRMSMPHSTAASSLHPVLWLRWALHSSGLPVVSTFWHHFASWRASRRPSIVSLLQYRDPSTKVWRGKARTAQGVGKLVGYTIDQILAQERFSFDEYTVQWRLKRVRFAAVIVRRPAARRVELVCGRETMRVLGECIHDEATAGTLGLLSPVMTDGKYTCTISPAQLLERLKSRYLTITRYSDSTLRRGLSTFVRCARSRPGGVRRPHP